MGTVKGKICDLFDKLVESAGGFLKLPGSGHDTMWKELEPKLRECSRLQRSTSVEEYRSFFNEVSEEVRRLRGPEISGCFERVFTKLEKVQVERFPEMSACWKEIQKILVDRGLFPDRNAVYMKKIFAE